jgi:phosphatidate cytidylyltransferase
LNQREDPEEGHRPARGRRRATADGPVEDAPSSGPPTERVRIAGVEAAVAAGLVTGTEGDDDMSPEGLDDLSEDFPAFEPEPGSTGLALVPGEMPDWSDPPTGQVPRVLLDAFEDANPQDEGAGPAVRGPVWRERERDWDDEEDLSHLAVEGETLITAEGGSPDDVDPYHFDFGPRRSRVDEPSVVYGPERPDPELASDAAWDNWNATSTGSAAANGAAADREAEMRPRRPPRRHAARRPPARAPRRAAEAAGRGHLRTRVMTGAAIGVLAIVCFLAGSVATLVLSAVVVTVAAGECFGALRRGGYRPATLLGLLAVPACIAGAYLKGPSALIAVLAAFVIATMLWYVTGVTREDPLLNIGVTISGFAWVGFLGGFAGLLLSPASFPHRHGVAYLVGAVILTVANDVGAFAVGSRLGRHKLAPRVSPGKSWEGLVGGTLLTILVAVIVMSRFHPWTMGNAVGLGIIVSVLAPLGDLGESQFKRSLGLKDIGSLLPAHGGVLDRIDGILFVLPATYLLVRALHLG